VLKLRLPLPQQRLHSAVFEHCDLWQGCRRNSDFAALLAIDWPTLQKLPHVLLKQIL
jgi:hypothetical protein